MGWLVQAEAPPGALFRKFREIILAGCVGAGTLGSQPQASRELSLQLRVPSPSSSDIYVRGNSSEAWIPMELRLLALDRCTRRQPSRVVMHRRRLWRFGETSSGLVVPGGFRLGGVCVALSVLCWAPLRAWPLGRLLRGALHSWFDTAQAAASCFEASRVAHARVRFRRQWLQSHRARRFLHAAARDGVLDILSTRRFQLSSLAPPAGL